MAVFVPPVVYDNPPIYKVWPDRYHPVSPQGQRLRSFAGGQARGRSVLKTNGVYVTVDGPTQTAIAAADEVYLGGHEYNVSTAVALALAAAGYSVTGDLLTAESGDHLTAESGDQLLTEFV